MLKTLEQACAPRPSVFDHSIRDTVYNIDDLPQIDPYRFFAENYVTQGMRQLLTETFKRLEGKSQNASGAFLLSQSMGGGKTHNLIALGLLAKYPELRGQVMSGFYTPGLLGTVRVITFSGRKTHTPFGIWGEIAAQLGRESVFAPFYSPLKPPGDHEWIELLEGNPVLLLLDELPPYFEAQQTVQVGATTLDRITTTALANLLVAVTSGKLPNVCVVLTDLRSSAYGVGSAAMNEALKYLEMEANRSVVAIDPVRLASDELYHILRTRLFEHLPEEETIEATAVAYAQVIDEARRMDLTTAAPQQVRSDIRQSYPFHPGIRDLYARFRENVGFQQTRALIRIMRTIVADLWQNGAARQQYLIGAHDFDLHRSEIVSEIRQINNSLDNAVAHDIAADGRNSVAEQIDASGGTDAQDAAKLIFLSSLSRAVNPTLGLDRSEIVAYLTAPGRNIAQLRNALDSFQSRAWYLHAAPSGALLFKHTENLNAKLESYAQGMLNEQRETELRDRLRELFGPKTSRCYGDVQALPALDQVVLTQDRVTLIIFRPSDIAEREIREFFTHQQFKNRMLFLTGSPASYRRVLERSAYLRAIRTIVTELRQQGLRDSDPQITDALQVVTREEAQFYLACRETFQQLLYPARNGLVKIDLDLKYTGNRFDGEEQIITALVAVHKFQPDANADNPSFRTTLENKLWPETKEAIWSDIKRRAASDPSWVWHHPRALDEVKDEWVRRDIWRDLGDGFVQRGPFSQPKTSVTIQQLARDPAMGEATLRIRALHGDVVFYSEDGPATTSSTRLDGTDLKTSALCVSFLAVDTRGEHETGDPVAWENTIDLQYRFYQQSDRMVCELRATPGGEIRYTVDGSSPESAGKPYAEPFLVPSGARVVLARASAAGITSSPLRVDVPSDRAVDRPVVDPQKPAVLKRHLTRDSTGETYQFLETAARHSARLGGIRIDVGRDSRFVSLNTDDKTFQDASDVRELARRLMAIIEGGNLTLETERIQFNRGQELLDMIADLKTALKPGEVEQ
jgi:Protein of unknown function (DUF499)/Chitobiase/beta-hexosaminidase C-terminal domain